MPPLRIGGILPPCVYGLLVGFFLLRLEDDLRLVDFFLVESADALVERFLDRLIFFFLTVVSVAPLSVRSSCGVSGR